MFKKFTLREANTLLPEIIKITQETLRKLEHAKNRVEADEFARSEQAQAAYHTTVNAILDEWANKISALGVLPKGYFTCDFISPNPDTYFCWTFGETQITHTHKVTQSFKDRIPLDEPEYEGFRFSRN